MSATRPADESAPDAVAAALSDAPFVRIVARADGDALAAAGLLARALRDRAVPFQVHVDPDPAPEPVADDAVSVTTGSSAPTADHALVRGAEPASVAAARVSDRLGVDPDPVLGLAGAVAAGSVPGADGTDQLLAAAEEHDLLDRRPGVAIPVPALADGLAHSTLLSASFSGDPDAASDAIGSLNLSADAAALTTTDLDADDHRRVASLVAVEVVADEDAVSGAAAALERALRPYATPRAPFATLGGYADVLGAVAREQPGTGVALALDHQQAREAALDAWRRHARAVHAAVRNATTGRYDGLLVARLEGDSSDGSDSGALTAGRLTTAARLLSAFRSPEPVTLALADGTAVAVGDADRQLGRVMANTEPATVGYGTDRCGEAEFDTDESTFIAAFREAL